MVILKKTLCLFQGMSAFTLPQPNGPRRNLDNPIATNAEQRNIHEMNVFAVSADTARRPRLFRYSQTL